MTPVTRRIVVFKFLIFTQFHCIRAAEEQSSVYLRVPKCCPFGSSLVLSENAIGCLNYSSTSHRWRGFFYDKGTLHRLTFHQHEVLILEYYVKTLKCEYSLARSSSTTKFSWAVKLLTDGTAAWYCRACPCKKWIPVDSEFCIDGLGEKMSGGNMYYSGLEDDQALAFCPPTGRDKTVELIFMWTFFISSVFYLAIAIIYALLWETHNLHGWTVLALVISRFCMCVFMGLAHVFDVNGYEIKMTLTCKVVGILAHFFILSSFTWLAVLCFNIWSTFRDLKPQDRKAKITKTYLAYAAFALGLPLLVVIVSLILNQNFKGTETEFTIPDYGNGICFVTACARGHYIFSIIGGLLILSVLLALSTIRTIYKFRQASASVRTSKSKTDTKGYLIYAKLGVVMGVTWILEFVSWAVQPSDNKPEPWYWIAVDLFNILISAILIFIIFICKWQVLDQLNQKYPTVQALTKFISDKWSSVHPPGARKPKETIQEPSHTASTPLNPKSIPSYTK